MTRKIKVGITVAIIVGIYLFTAWMVLAEQDAKRTEKNFSLCPLCNSEVLK